MSYSRGSPFLFAPIARLEIYFSPEACAELSKIPACRLARAAVYVGMQNLSLGHHLSSNLISERTFVANLTQRMEKQMA